MVAIIGAMLRDSSIVVRTRPRAVPLAIITMRKSIHGFPFVPYMGTGLRLAALRTAGAPLKMSLHLGCFALGGGGGWGGGGGSCSGAVSARVTESIDRE